MSTITVVSHAPAPPPQPRRFHIKSAGGWWLPANTIVLPDRRRYSVAFALCVSVPDQPGHRGVLTRVNRVARFQAWTDTRGDAWHRAVRRLFAGRHLACTCPIDQPCHADVLLRLANSPVPDLPAAATSSDAGVGRSTP
jgi:hypothetical protein